MTDGIRVERREPEHEPGASGAEDVAHEGERPGAPASSARESGFDIRGTSARESGESAPIVRSRLRRALLCPYCHDDVGRTDALLCARSGCGALYHRECWHEVLESYGGCAVYGCGSTHASEVSVRAWFARILKLLVATALFPPRVLRAFVYFEERSDREIQGLVRQRGWRVIAGQTATSAREFATASGGLLVLAMAIATAFVLMPELAAPASGESYGVGAGLALVGVGLVIVLALVGVTAFGLTLVRALALVLLAEIGVLARADSRPSFVSRMRRGGGRKS